MTMRLLYLHPVPVPSISANAVQVAKMCDAFAGVGVEIKLVTPRRSSSVKTFEALANTYSLKRRFALGHAPLTRMPGNAMLFSALACIKYRLSGSFTVYTRAVPIAYAAHLLGIPYILEMHEPVIAFRPVAMVRLHKMSRSPLFRQLVTISDCLRRDYTNRFPSLANRISVAHDGADPFQTDANFKPRQLAGSFKVGYVGHLYPGKGMEIIVPLARLCPWANFHIVGGRPGDLEKWRGQAEDVSNLEFHGHVPHAETTAYIAAMDVVLAPYQKHVSGAGKNQNLADWMSPLKMFEYMAQGKAILASDLPVLREVLHQGESAILCDPGDVSSWVSALTMLHTNRGTAERIGQRALTEFLANYSWDQRAVKILNTLRA